MVRQDTTGRPRVVVVGSGFGGYTAVRALRKADLDVTLIAATDGMLYAPLLPDVAVGAIDPRSAVVPLIRTLKPATVVRGRVHRVDLAARRVHYVGADDADHALDYDRLLLAPGGVTRLLDIPGLADHAIGLKTVTEALYLRDHVLGRIELAAALPAGQARTAALTFVVVGAGYAGTELTAQMARLTARLLADRPGLTPEDARWLLVDVAEAVMPELGEALGKDALALLRRRRVDVRLGVSVAEVTADTVRLTDGTSLDCSTLVWCAGVAANPLIGDLDLPTAKGRLVVDPDLRVPGHREVYAVGDAAAVPDLTKPVDDDGHRPLCPPTAQHATRQATAAARNIRADLGGGMLHDYEHHDLGLVVDLGGPDAAATPLGLHLKGRPAKLVTRGYHLLAMPTLRRRARVAADWLLTGTRPDDVSFGVVDRDEALIGAAEGERPSS